MSDTRAPNAKAIPSLDGIRAISVLIVAVSHAGLGTFVPGGLGVTIFFFLSGYLITTLLLSEQYRTGKIDIPKFYARRVFRLMPPLLITLAIAYSLTSVGLLAGGITVKGVASQLLYFANYYGLFFDPGHTIPDGTGILWSLAVEEHFYIFYPIILAVLLKIAFRPRSIATVLGIACIAILAWRILLVQAPNFDPTRTYYASDTRIDSIIYGCILAIGMRPLGTSRRVGAMSLSQWSLFATALGALLLSLLIRETAFRETIRYSLQGIALMPLFYFAVRFPENRLFRFLNMSWIMKVGTYSYVIYLMHLIVINVITQNGPAISTKFYVLFPCAILISLVYAAAIDRFVDRYFRQLRLKYRPGSARASSRPILQPGEVSALSSAVIK
ncbi:MAG TPA: acyltransferase [Tepidisphaeraceae bacterium]|nr:acyltransferase [Tepidisphaeraceae bacterium]